MTILPSSDKESLRGKNTLVRYQNSHVRLFLCFVSLILFARGIQAREPEREIDSKANHHKAPRHPGSQEITTGAVIGADPMADSLHYRIQSVVYTGYTSLNQGGSAYTMGSKLGYAPVFGLPLYVGPEAMFSLYSPGSLFSLGGAAWYEFRRFPNKNFRLVGGVGMGAAFPTNMRRPSSTTWSVYVEAGLTRELNDLAAIQLTLRPGLIGSRITFNALANIVFRFL